MGKELGGNAKKLMPLVWLKFGVGTKCTLINCKVKNFCHWLQSLV